MTTLEHPSSADCCMVPRLKSVLKGRRFCDSDSSDIINAMEEMEMLLQDGFQECF